MMVLVALAGCGPRASDVDVAGTRVPDAVYGVPNNDFANQWDNPRFDDDDLSSFLVQPHPSAHELRLSLGDGRRFHRIWHAGDILLDADVDTATVSALYLVALKAEFGDFNQRTELTIEALDADGALLDTRTVTLASSPLLLNHHLQASEHVYALQSFGNEAMIRDYRAILGDHFSSVDGPTYGFDVWLQDEIELAWGVAPGGRRMNVAIDSIRDRGLDDMPEDLLRGEDFGVLTWGNGLANTLDSFGNLEVSPPVEGFPQGRIYYGALDGFAPRDTVLFDKLERQVIQDPFTVDTSWLCVGHVDEFMSFVPDSNAPRGFRFIYTDITLGYALLDAMDPGIALDRYAGPNSHGFDTVGDLVTDNGLRLLNEDTQVQILDPILEQMISELGLLDEEIVLFPGIFEEPAGCAGALAALTPGMANLIVTNQPGEPSKVFMADPYLRADESDLDADPYIAAVRDAMPAELQLHFLDDFQTYHLALGEVHCGTNVVRTPPPEFAWWTPNGGDE